MAKVRKYESTPNPDALKCLLDAPISDRPRSFIGAEQAEGDPIAGPMFAGAKLRAVLINTDWISINKEPGADWKDIKPIVERVLADV
ncbi:MAG: NifU N-terminal domain-containing protein [Phycisphaerales bacterium JB061]